MKNRNLSKFGPDQNGYMSIIDLSKYDWDFLVIDKRLIYSAIYNKVCTAFFTHWGNVIFEIKSSGKHIEISANALTDPWKDESEIIKIKIITKEQNLEYYL